MRTGSWLAVVLAPLALLVVLLARPKVDIDWENQQAHFWLVLGAAVVATTLGWAISAAARRRRDARLFLISLAFIASSGFLGLHALATPTVLLGPNAGFELATPFGLVVAGVFAATSAIELRPKRARSVVRHARLLLGCLFALMAAWAVVSLAELPPLDGPLEAEELDGWQLVLAAVGLGLYGLAALGYVRLYRRRPERFVFAFTLAFAFLAEAMVVIAWASNWRLSWWEWHILMLGAFLVIGQAARSEWHEERFSALYLDETLAGAKNVSIVLADLEGYTRFSEDRPPANVAVMLNAYFERIIPLMERDGRRGAPDRRGRAHGRLRKARRARSRVPRSAREPTPAASRAPSGGRPRRLAAVPGRRVERRGPRGRRRRRAGTSKARARR